MRLKGNRDTPLQFSAVSSFNNPNEPPTENIMKYVKSSLIALTVALAASSAHAADALDMTRVRFGINFGFGSGIGFTADASLNNLAQIAPGINLGARVSAGYIPNVFSIAAAPVATFAFQNGGVWVGPSIALAIAGAVDVGFGLTTGVEYNVNQQIMLYSGLYLGVLPSVAGLVNAGVDIDITNNFSGYFEARTNFGSGTSFGLGAGVAYRF